MRHILRSTLVLVAIAVVIVRCSDDIRDPGDTEVVWVSAETDLETHLERIRALEQALRDREAGDTSQMQNGDDTATAVAPMLTRQLDIWAAELQEIADMIETRRQERKALQAEGDAGDYDAAWQAAEEDYRRSIRRIEQIEQEMKAAAPGLDAGTAEGGGDSVDLE